MKHCCRNCHFLQKLHVYKKENEFETALIKWDEDDRNSFSPLKDNLLVYCAKEIWHSPSGSRNISQLEGDLTKDRQDECYFVEYRERMGFEAADNLQRRQYETRQFNKSLRHTQYGLWMAAGGLVASLIFQILVVYKIIP